MDAVRHLEPGVRQSGIIGNSFQYPCYHSDESNDDVLSVGAVRPMPKTASMNEAEIVDVSHRQADVVDDVLFLRNQGLMDSPGTCCAQKDDIDWAASPYVRDLGLAERYVDVGAPDIGRKLSEVPVALPVLADVTVSPVVWPVVTKTEPQVDCVSVDLLPDRGSEMITDVCRDFSCSPDMGPVMRLLHWETEDTGVTQDAQLRTESCPIPLEKSARVPMSLPVENNTETQVDVRWEPTSVVVPSGEVTGGNWRSPLADRCVSGVVEGFGDGAFPVVADTDTQVEVGWEPTSVVALSSCVSGCPVGWLDTESD